MGYNFRPETMPSPLSANSITFSSLIRSLFCDGGAPRIPKNSVLKVMQDCEHAELSDAGICQTCGVDITSQEFLDSLPEAPPDSQLGDTMGIIRVAMATAQEYIDRVQAVRDPNSPGQPKMRWVGTQLVRPPRESIWLEVLRPAFTRAKELGYRGDFERWDSVIVDYVAFVIATKNSSKM